MVFRRNSNCGNIYNVMISVWPCIVLKCWGGEWGEWKSDYWGWRLVFSNNRIVEVENVLRGTLSSEMVEANVTMKSVDLVLVWIYSLALRRMNTCLVKVTSV